MSDGNMTRRGLMLGGLVTAAAGLASGCSPVIGDMGVTRSYAFPAPPEPDARFKRRSVRYDGDEAPGTIVVNTTDRFLYFVQEDGWATRYGVGVGEEGLTLKGHAKVGRKAEWPSWTPTQSMLERKPHLMEYAGGVPGGPSNPLGARALYLYRGGQDTMFRIHGTNEPWTIGTAVSSGCIRLTNDDIVDLYERVPRGTAVLVI
ncbi:L,D-transpeptidase [Mesorhizobium xinjiangense]|uniref:L,D-transpeptidase n=1 Tax=Mesorhizobium xinjiangense TaxID=2678685 RepID=UPI0012ED5EE6|nr:L,D-transpeptidase [Mesorhizobium xinjiangense]